MSGDHLFTFRVGYAGRSREVRVGRTAAMVAASVLGVLFVLLTQGIYDIRDNISKLHELRALRERVSEQNLALYHLDAKFEGLSAEVERLRAMDNRIRSLVKANDSLRRKSSRGVGGAETPEASVANRLDKLLDLKFDRMKKDLLVDVNDLDVLGETLDGRRLLLESVPDGWPVRGTLSSVFGVRNSPFTETPVFHHGLDIVARTGMPVVASAPGVVVKSGYESLYGNIGRGRPRRGVPFRLCPPVVVQRRGGCVRQPGRGIGESRLHGAFHRAPPALRGPRERPPGEPRALPELTDRPRGSPS